MGDNYQIEITTRNGQTLVIQRTSSTSGVMFSGIGEVYLQEAIKREYPGCQIHKISKITSIQSNPNSELQNTDQFSEDLNRALAADPENKILQQMHRNYNTGCFEVILCIGLIVAGCALFEKWLGSWWALVPGIPLGIMGGMAFIWFKEKIGKVWFTILLIVIILIFGIIISKNQFKINSNNENKKPVTNSSKGTQVVNFPIEISDGEWANFLDGIDQDVKFDKNDIISETNFTRAVIDLSNQEMELSIQTHNAGNEVESIKHHLIGLVLASYGYGMKIELTGPVNSQTRDIIMESRNILHSRGISETKFISTFKRLISVSEQKGMPSVDDPFKQ